MSEGVSQSPKVNVHILTWLLAACSMIGPFATDMYMPSFQEMTEVFGVSQQAVQQTLFLRCALPWLCRCCTAPVACIGQL